MFVTSENFEESERRCGPECECGEILVFYENPRYPAWGEDPFFRRSVPFAYVSESRAAQLEEMHDALQRHGVVVSREENCIRVLAVLDGMHFRWRVLRLGFRAPIRPLGEPGWSIVVGNVEARDRASRRQEFERTLPDRPETLGEVGEEAMLRREPEAEWDFVPGSEDAARSRRFPSEPDETAR